MSKSLGNLVFVNRLLAEGHDPMAVRLAILAHHYRHDWDWTTAGLAAAAERLARWREAAREAPADFLPAAEAVLAGVRERLADDLDAPGALAVVDAWADQVLAAGRAGAGQVSGSAGHAGAGDASGAAGLVRDTVDALLGVAL
jgi:L-cysteine:1D-myo-inositol 2-amino-2-deoxy-alpha-D-glucopyranoside ligase